MVQQSGMLHSTLHGTSSFPRTVASPRFLKSHTSWGMVPDKSVFCRYNSSAMFGCASLGPSQGKKAGDTDDTISEKHPEAKRRRHVPSTNDSPSPTKLTDILQHSQLGRNRPVHIRVRQGQLHQLAQSPVFGRNRPKTSICPTLPAPWEESPRGRTCPT